MCVCVEALFVYQTIFIYITVSGDKTECHITDASVSKYDCVSP